MFDETNSPFTDTHPGPERLPVSDGPGLAAEATADAAPANGVSAAESPAEVNGAAVPFEDRSRYAEAGRKGAERVHQLIRHGRLYEQEHGLKRGRQRLRQLLEEGKLYEQEHSLRPPRQARRRLGRASREQVLRTFLETVVRMVRPSYRQRLQDVLAALDGEGK